MPEPHLAPGVWLAPYTVRGDRVYYGVGPNGELAGMRYVAIGHSPDQAIDELWEKVEAAGLEPPSSPLKLLR